MVLDLLCPLTPFFEGGNIQSPFKEIAHATPVDVSRSVPRYVYPQRGSSSPEEFLRGADAWWHSAVSLEEILQQLRGWLLDVWDLIKQIWDALTLD